MTSTFKLNIPEQFRLATRPDGIVAREKVLMALKNYELVELDFAGADPTPSFADECVGLLCKTIGWEAFTSRIKILNVTDMSRPLLKVVISKRRSEIQA